MLNNSTISSSVAFIGIGQCGGNIASCFKDLGYTTFYINSSAKDLSTINVPKQYKWNIPMADGCAKNRVLAKSYFKKYKDTILNLIRSKLNTFSYIFVCCGAGGGTGSGMTPSMLDEFSETFKDIKFGIIASLPDKFESPKAKYNAYEFYDEIKDLAKIGNTYFIDNNNKFMDGIKATTNLALNKSFADKLNELLCMGNANVDGITDDKEVLTALSVNGYSLVADILANNKNIKERIKVDISMPTTNRGCSYIAYSITSDDMFLQREVEDMFGKPSDFYKGYNDNASFVAVFGLPFPHDVMNNLATSINDDVEAIEYTEMETAEKSQLVELDEFIDPVQRIRKSKETSKKLRRMMDNMIDINEL